MVPTPPEEIMSFVTETDLPTGAGRPVWQVLIVDDEPDVHQATALALNNVAIEGRHIEFIHAYSAAEARSCLAEHEDIAVVLLDVVMESPDAGLQLVRHIREELRNHALRVILRTGQPGYAPEIETIRSYDINDYKTKSEMTRVRLFTSLTVAIRSYWQIHQLEANRRGLELIIAASTELNRPRGLQRFAEGIVTQLCALLGVREEGVVCAASAPPHLAPSPPSLPQPMFWLPPGVIRDGLACRWSRFLTRESGMNWNVRFPIARTISAKPRASTSAPLEACRLPPSSTPAMH